MPRKVVDYSKTVIYKLVCKDVTVTDCYDGSTTSFTKRKCGHKTTCNNKASKDHNLPVYRFIRDNGGFDNWDMIEVETYNAVNKLEALKRERYY